MSARIVIDTAQLLLYAFVRKGFPAKAEQIAVTTNATLAIHCNA